MTRQMSRPVALLGARAVRAGDHRAGSRIASLDVTVVNIALPAFERDFHTGIAAPQWVMTGYT